MAVQPEKRCEIVRITITWLIAIFLTFVLIGTWYITQPIIVATSNLAEDITEDLAVNRTGTAQTYTLLRLGANVGIPLLIIFIWIWAVISSQHESWAGYEV